MNVRRLISPLAASFLLLTTVTEAQVDANVARLVVWQPKPGLKSDFEEGYKRHLEWHRRNHDTWAWHGWTISSGERGGYFMDGTFSHRWTDLDSPVSPAADGADNDLNVNPYADVRSVATYEAIAGQADRELLTSPLVTLYRFDLVPGAAAEFESLISAELRTPGAAGHAFLRPANGATDYLLLLPAHKASEYGAQAEFVRRLLDAVRRSPKAGPLVVAWRTESARYRPDLSNVPDGAP